MSKLKLFTEEQVELAIIEFIKNDCTLSRSNVNKTIAKLTPIELPTDEEKEAFAMGYYNGEGHEYYVNIGIEWVIDKIKKQQ